MKIAIIGTRGVPARYGGFETIAEALSTGLVKKGHVVFVYCRKGNIPESPKKYQGINLVYTSYFTNKYLGTFSHVFFSITHAIFQKYDIALVFNVGVAPLCALLKLFNIKVILNVDGFEWYRKKWKWFAKIYFIFCALIAKFIVNEIITDSKDVQSYYQRKLSTKTTYITNGAYVSTVADNKILKKFNVLPYEYFFTASRLVPENNIDLMIRTYININTKKLFLIAGGSSYSDNYENKINEAINDRIVMLGPIYNPVELAVLHTFCYAYIHGNDAGGTSLGLLKALGYGNCVLTINTHSNKEVVGDSAILYDKSVLGLAQKIEYVLKNPKKVKVYRIKARERVRRKYTWNKIIDLYEKLFNEVLIRGK